MHVNHLPNCCMTEITSMSVGLESNFFRSKQISKIFANIDMISGVYKKFSGKQWKLKKLYLRIVRGVARK